jgi:hypothetical protein
MSRPIHAALAIAALALTACTEPTGGNSLLLNEAFQSVPVGFSANSNSFDPAGDRGDAFYPGAMGQVGMGQAGMGGMGMGGRMGGGGRGAQGQNGDHHDGFGPGARGMMMGGGLGPDFTGLGGFGGMYGRGPFGTFHVPANCAYDAALGRVECPVVTNNGLTIERSFAFKESDGDVQQAFDSATTDYVNIRTAVAGTRTRRDNTATSTVSHTSDRTVTGLTTAVRTINGTAEAEETTTGTRDGVEFTATRTASDKTENLTIPVTTGRPPIPTSGTVTRTMTVTIDRADADPVTRTRTEVITYDGTNVVKVVITQGDVTKNCTITLPGRRLVCE